MLVQSLRNAPAPKQSHDREPHPVNGCSRDDGGADWRRLKRHHHDIFSTADAFAVTLSPKQKKILRKQEWVADTKDSNFHVPLSKNSFERNFGCFGRKFNLETFAAVNCESE